MVFFEKIVLYTPGNFWYGKILAELREETGCLSATPSMKGQNAFRQHLGKKYEGTACLPATPSKKIYMKGQHALRRQHLREK